MKTAKPPISKAQNILNWVGVLILWPSLFYVVTHPSKPTGKSVADQGIERYCMQSTAFNNSAASDYSTCVRNGAYGQRAY